MRSSSWRNATIVVAMALSSIVCAHPGPGIVVDPTGTVYFVYGPSSRVWRVNGNGEAAILVEGGLDEDFRVPHHLYLDEEELLVTASDAGGRVWRISADGVISPFPRAKQRPLQEEEARPTIGLGGDPFIVNPHDGSMFSVDRREDSQGMERLVRIDEDGAVTVVAGAHRGAMRDGMGDGARFAGLHSAGFAWAPNGDLLLSDGGKAIRRVTRDGAVSTITDHHAAPFEMLIGLAVSDAGVIYAADYYGHRIYRVESDGATRSLAGTGERGSGDGDLSQASFDGPVGLALQNPATLFVLEITQSGDRESARIRRIDLDTKRVETVVEILDP